MARDFEFRIKEEGLYYLCSKNKGADQPSLFSHMQKSSFLMTWLNCKQWRLMWVGIVYPDLPVLKLKKNRIWVFLLVLLKVLGQIIPIKESVSMF